MKLSAEVFTRTLENRETWWMNKRTGSSLSWFCLNQYLIIFYSGAPQLQVKPELPCRLRQRLKNFFFFSVRIEHRNSLVWADLSCPYVSWLALVKYQPGCISTFDRLPLFNLRPTIFFFFHAKTIRPTSSSLFSNSWQLSTDNLHKVALKLSPPMQQVSTK